MARAPALGWRGYSTPPGMEAKLASHLPGPQQDGSTLQTHPGIPLMEGCELSGTPIPTGNPVLPHIVPIPKSHVPSKLN